MTGAAERFREGQERRKLMRRADHGSWKVGERKVDALKLLAAAEKGRIPALVLRKRELMAASPFGYFRGAVPVMAYDLSLMGNTGIFCQLCGDAHVRNLGAFAAPDGRLTFDVNDYDETIVGPFEWDVKRMATSLVLAARGTGMKDARCTDVAMLFLETYRTMMAEFAKMPVLEVARYQVHRLDEVSPVEGILKIAERATPLHSLSALTEVVEKKTSAAKGTETQPEKKAGPDGGKERVFRSDPPSLTRVDGELAAKVMRSLKKYEETLLPERRHFLAQYKAVDVAFKVVGTGSVGLRDYCVYMQGNGKSDPLFLQVKQEVASGYAPYIERATGRKLSGAKVHQGQRVVEGERAMQVQSDPFLGWTSMDGRDYMVRQLNDHKASIQLDSLKPVWLMEYAGVCGEILARGHARAGDSSLMAGYLGNSARFDEAVTEFAMAYADQTERDWKELVGSLKKDTKA